MKDSKKSESLEALEKLRDSLPRPPKDTQLDEATLDVLFDDVSPDQRAIAEMQRERDELFGTSAAPPVTPGKYSPRDEALVQVAIALGMPNAQVPKTVREIRDWAEKHRPLSEESTTAAPLECPRCGGDAFACPCPGDPVSSEAHPGDWDRTAIESHCAKCERCQVYKKMADDEAVRHATRANALEAQLAERRTDYPTLDEAFEAGWTAACAVGWSDAFGNGDSDTPRTLDDALLEWKTRPSQKKSNNQ